MSADGNVVIIQTVGLMLPHTEKMSSTRGSKNCGRALRMNGESSANNIYFPCRMMKRDMCEGECYDVQMDRVRLIKESRLEFALDRELAKEICGGCEYNQLNSPEISKREKPA